MADEDQAAPGLMASTLLTAAEAHEKTRPSSASSGLNIIDDLVLHGGFRYGEVTSIAGASGLGKTLFVFHAIASHLLSSEKGEVAFVDTTGSFCPLGLRNVLASRLESQSRRSDYRQVGYGYQSTKQSAAINHERFKEQATHLLDRVKVMRVFDFAGAIEALGEIRQIWEKQDEYIGNAVNTYLANGEKVVYDSDEESLSVGSVEFTVHDDELTKGKSNPYDDQVRMFIVDTITNVVGAMVSRNQVQGQALLASFMRSLRHLTYRRHICSVLTNTAVGLNPSMYPRRAQENASIFEATVGKPALGKAFTCLIDTSIFLSSIPKMRLKAEIAYGGGDSLGWKKVGVLEVLQDRFGAQEGRWAAFEITAEVFLSSPM